MIASAGFLAGPLGSNEHSCLVVIGSLTRGGAERQAILSATALQAAGVRTLLHVATPPFRLLEDARSAGLELDLPPPGETRLGQLRRLRRAAERSDVAGVITFLAGPSMRFLTVRAVNRRLQGLPWIVAERGNAHASGRVRSRMRALLHAKCLRCADRVAVNSSVLGSNMFTFFEPIGLKTSVVPNIVVPFEVDTERARDEVRRLVGREARGPVLGAVGSFHADRNYELLAEAFALVLRGHPRAHLVIVGRDSGVGCDAQAGRFRARVHELGVADHVSMAGDVAGARTLLPGFDAVVLSSKLEGSSNALAEALVAGAAIATTPAGDAEQLTSGAAAISSGWTPDALADAIYRVVTEPELWKLRAGQRGRQLLEERSPERVGACWLRLLEEARAVARIRTAMAVTLAAR